MKNNYLKISLIAVLLALLVNCKKDEPNINITPVPNHEIRIFNRSGTQGVAKQFTYLTLTPTEAGESEVPLEFVCNPQSDVFLKIYLSKITFFKVKLSLYKNGPSIWWNSIAFAPDGISSINIQNNASGFGCCTYLNNLLLSDGNDLPAN